MQVRQSMFELVGLIGKSDQRTLELDGLYGESGQRSMIICCLLVAGTEFFMFRESCCFFNGKLQLQRGDY